MRGSLLWENLPVFFYILQNKTLKEWKMELPIRMHGEEVQMRAMQGRPGEHTQFLCGQQVVHVQNKIVEGISFLEKCLCN